MIRPFVLTLSLLLLLPGCPSGSTGADTRRYACRQDDECATGFVCRAGTCQGGPGPTTPPGDGGGPGDADAGDPGDGGGADAGTPDGGGSPNDGGTATPTRLGFVSPAQTVDTGQCVAVAVETQTAAGGSSPVSIATTILLSTQPTPGVGLFRDAACTTATSTVTVDPGGSRVTFYFRGTTAQSVRLGAAASGLEPAEQTVTVRAGPANVVFVSEAQTLPAGGCSGLIELEARDANARPTFFSSPRDVTLSGTDLTFYSNPACTTPLSNPVFAANSARFSFFFKGKRGGTLRLSAQVSGVAQVSQDQSILPVVRKNLCKMPADRSSVLCSFPAGMPAQLDMSKTLLFFQASPDGTSPASGAVRCWLSAQDAVTCGRNSTGALDIDIYWQTVELSAGVRVQHVDVSCAGVSTLRIPIFPVSPGKSFLLTSQELGGNMLGDDDFYTAKLAESGSQVEIQFSTGCNSAWKGRLQVVEMDGIQVTRGTTSMTGALTQAGSYGVPSADLSTSALLFTYRVSNGGTSNVCDRAVRGELTSPAVVAFSRGAGTFSGCTTAAIDEIAWERITFGPLARVQPVAVTIFPNSDIARPTISTAVDTTRSVVFASNQVMNGQSGGESSYSGDDILAESLAAFEFVSPTQLLVNRVSDEGRGRWTSYVVQFEP